MCPRCKLRACYIAMGLWGLERWELCFPCLSAEMAEPVTTYDRPVRRDERTAAEMFQDWTAETDPNNTKPDDANAA